MKTKIAVHESPFLSKIPPGDPRWGTFNDRFVNQELELADIANAIWTGHPYTTWHNGRRKLANFTEAQHIAIDLDSNDKRSTFAHLQKNELVRLYGALMHTTPSHTAEDPRARVIFTLDEPITCQEKYKNAVKFIVAQFDGADTATTDASRFFYGAKECDIWLGDGILPMAHLRIMYKAWRKDVPAEAPKPAYVPPADADPAQEITKLQAALSKIDPWRIEMNQWIAVLAAIHDTMGDAALPLAESWAQGTPGEVRRRWRTFGNYGGNNAGLGTVYHLAAH